MKRNFSFFIFTIACCFFGGRVAAQIVGTNIFLQGAYLEIGSQRNGSLGSSVSAPSGYHPHPDGSSACGGSNTLASVSDYQYTGWSSASGHHYMGDYTLPGTPWEQWDLEVTSSSTTGVADAYGCSTTSLTGGWASYTNTGGQAVGVWNGSMLSGGLTIHKTYTVDTFGLALKVNVVLTNTTGSAMTGVYYYRGSDPDNSESWRFGSVSGSYSTNNEVIYQNDYYHRVMVTAYATASGSPASASTDSPPGPYSLGTKDCRAKAFVNSSWPVTATNFSGLWSEGSWSGGTAYYDVGTVHSGDIAIGIVFNIGTIPAYDSATFTYAYIYNGSLGLDSAFPNPQMVVAGVAYDSIDTIGCSAVSSSTLPVNIINGNTNCWSWSTWTWAPATGLSSTTGVSNTVNMSAITTETTYTITGTDSSSGSCNAKTFLLTIIPPPPSVSVVNNSPLCPGDPLIITVTNPDTSSSVTYSWTGPGGFTAATQNITIPSCVTGDSGLFSLVVNNGGCTQDTSTFVIVHSTPGSPTIADVTYCQYASTVPLTAGGSNILWYNSATGGVGTRVAPVPSSTTAGTFTWYVTQTINSCESARYPINVTINPLPAPPTITDVPGAYCPGSPWNTFTYASGTGSVLWYTSETGGTGTSVTPVVNTSIPGIDTFWASQTLLGCEGPRALVTILVYDSVVAHFDTLTHWGCHGDTLYFNNSSFGASYYLWTFGDGTSSADANPSHVYPVQAIDTVKLYAHSAFCVDSLIRIFDMRHPDTSRFTVAPSIACQNTPVSFTNTSIATGPAYTWSFGDGGTSTAASPSHTYTNTGTYNIQLIVTDFVPCRDTSYGTVSVDTMSGISVSVSDTAFCMGTYITVGGSYAALGDTQLIWNLGNGDIIYNSNPLSYAYTSPGTYVITALTKYRVCPDASASRTVTVVTQPTLNLGPDTSICPGSETSVALFDGINAHTSGASWLWSTGETASGISVTGPGVYYATVSIGGCTASDTVIVSDACTYNISNCFSPNGDGVNDYFNPRDNLSKDITSFSMSIYNRWGELVFQTKSIDGRGWDGNFNATAQPQGVYIYVISATFADGQNINKTGNLTLLR